jgi:hypothetical protein
VLAEDSIALKKIKVLPVPAFGYSPETRTYIGAVTLFTFQFHPRTRTSNAKLEFNYTWNKQMVFEAGWNYFFTDEKWFTKGIVHHSYYPDLYYGIGGNTADSNELSFNSRRTIIETYILRKIVHQFFTGINFRYSNYSRVEHESNNLKFTELNNSNINGIGYTILNDNRNNILSPTSGFYRLFNATYQWSETKYLKFQIDLRYYKTWKNKFTLASRIYNEFNTSQPPFFDYAYLGGDKFVRGFYYGRYRDNHLSTFQNELRLRLIWRIGLSTFAGASSLYSSQNKFNLKDVKYNAGLGLRFLVDKKEGTHLRFDYAIGSNGNQGFYVAFGESF